MSSAADTGSADQHLGESLAALIDGELSHDSRDRVLAHLATCSSCKAEADAQRQLKSVFAQSPLPAPSDGLLARLQGLPASDGLSPESEDPPGPPAASPDEPPRPQLRPMPGGRRRESLLGPPVIGGERGFRIHEPGAALRPHRGHRLAFAAAGAVSLAAFAIGGAMSSVGTTGGAGSVSAGGSTLSTVAAGGGTPVNATRTATGRVEETDGTEEQVSLPVSLVSYGRQTPATASPAGLAEKLFPASGPILAPSQETASASSAPAPVSSGLAPAGGLGILEAMGPR